MKCPYCIEEIQDEAIICKHCHKDLTTKDAKLKKKVQSDKIKIENKIEETRIKNEEKQIIEQNKKDILLESVATKVALYPLQYQSSIKNDVKFLNKLVSMNEEDIKNDVEKRELSKNRWIVYIIGIIGIFAAGSGSGFIGSLLIFAAIWLFPRKGEKISINRFSSFKQYKKRILFSIIPIFIFFGWVGQVSSNSPIISLTETSDFKSTNSITGTLSSLVVDTYPTKDGYKFLKSDTGVTITIVTQYADTLDIDGVKITSTGGIFTRDIKLTNIRTILKIVATNEYHSTTKEISIDREKNNEDIRKEEEQKKLAIEQEEKRKKLEMEQLENQKKIDIENKKKAEEAERIKLQEEREWKNSKAGKICSKHPLWTHEDCKNISQGRYWIGMEYDMLVEGWGRPNSINPSNYGNGTSYQYCWHDMTPSCFYDRNGDDILDSYN